MTLRPGDYAPDFVLPLLSNGADSSTASKRVASLGEMLMRGPALLVFAKQSCPTCEYALPFVDRIHQRHEQSSVSVFVVAQETPFGALRMASEWGLKVPMLIDVEPHLVSERYGIEFVPSGLFINQRGMIENTFESFEREELKSISRKAAMLAGLESDQLFRADEIVPPFRPG